LENVYNVEIEAEIPRNWITDNDIDITSLNIYRFKDNVWQELESRIRYNEKRVIVRVISPGLSIFAIAGDKNRKDITEILEDEEVQNLVGKAYNFNLQELNPRIYWLILTLILTPSAIVAFMKRKTRIRQSLPGRIAHHKASGFNNKQIFSLMLREGYRPKEINTHLFSLYRLQQFISKFETKGMERWKLKARLRTHGWRGYIINNVFQINTLEKLKDYIFHARKYKMPLREIKNELKSRGWRTKDIRKALKK